MVTTSKIELVQLFCTVLHDFRPDGVTPIWEVNKFLHKHLLHLLEKHPNLTEDECTLYWLNIHRYRQITNPSESKALQTIVRQNYKSLGKLAESFLCRYLQRIAYQVAHKTYNSSLTQWQQTEQSRYKKDELFTIASAKIPVVLRNFAPDTISDFTGVSGSRLGAYAYQVFRNTLRAAISLQQIDRLSDWGLLVHGVSPTYLMKTLTEQGVDKPQIQYYRLLLECFQQVHQRSNEMRSSIAKETQSRQRLREPNALQLEKIVDLYNRLRDDRQNYRDLPALPLDAGETVKTALLECAHAVRASRQQPKILSLNKLLGDEDTELVDLLPDLQTQSPISTIAQDEFLTVLRQQVYKLPTQWQTAMELTYRKGLNQEAIADKCGVNQCTVSRWQKGDRGKGGWLRTLQEQLAYYYNPQIVLTAEILHQALGTDILEYYLEMLYSLPGSELVS
jgi:RNA polymerase sigma factor (sigma-70 family)